MQLQRIVTSLLLAGFCYGAILAPLPAQDKNVHPEVNKSIEKPDVRQSSIKTHTLRSKYQTGPTRVRVLLPDKMDENKYYPALYVLPVEAGGGTRWGDALAEIRRGDLHNKHGLICVFPEFSHLPWYADHASDATLRQESYLLRDVLPLVEKQYPVKTEKAGRLLVGFSKSGWGAWTLLLRHPDTFARAAAWDAPLMQDRPNKFGMGPIFGTQKNFEKYQITKLLEQRAQQLRPHKRLGLFGYGGFRTHHEQMHRRLEVLKIPHEYADGPQRKHAWNSGWLAESVEFLVGE